MVIWQKEVHPPETLTKRGTRLFVDGDVSSYRLHIQICCVCRAPWDPPNHPQFLFFPGVYSGWTRVIKSGVWASTPFWHACARVYPSISTKFGKSRCLARFYVFLARCGLVCPGISRKHRRWVTVPARGCCGTTKRLRPTSTRPTTQTRSNVISICDQYTRSVYVISISKGLVPWLQHTMMRHDESRSYVTPHLVISCTWRCRKPYDYRQSAPGTKVHHDSSSH